MTANNIPTTLSLTKEMEDSLTQIYHSIVGTDDTRIPMGNDGGLCHFQRGIFNLEELPTDESKWLWDPTDMGGINYGIVSPDLPVILGPWLRLTGIIDMCNRFLKNDFNLALIEDEQNKLKALALWNEYRQQVKIIRSAMYFYLLNEYGNVPYYDEESEKDTLPQQLSTDLPTGRKLVAEKVISTLEDVVNWYKTNDFVNKPIYGRVGLDVAEAILVKFYLNHEVFTGSPAWDKTLSHATAIIQRRGKGGFKNSGLAMNYFQNFSYNSPTAAENEIIWRIATKDPDGAELNSFSNGTFMMVAHLSDDFQKHWTMESYNSDCGWKCLVGLRQLSDIFEWNYDTKESPDQRVAWWGSAKHGFNINNASLTGDDWGENGFIPVKFTNWNINDDGEINTYDIPDSKNAPYCLDYGMIRLAEIYLSAAEAILMSSGDVTKALEYTNYVRERAGMPAFTTLDLEILQGERQRELYTECNRRTDLIRYSKWIKGYNWNWKGGTTSGRDYDPNFIVYPIPSSIIEKYGYVQNPLPAVYNIEPIEIEPSDWKLIGSFCNFDRGKAISMQPQGDGSYALTLSELEGSFGFVTGDPWDNSILRNGNLNGNLNGNVDIDLKTSGSYLEVEGKLTNVKLLLYPYSRVLRVMGQNKNQNFNRDTDSEMPLYLIGDICGWEANEDYKMTYEGKGIYSLFVKDLEGDFKFEDPYFHSVSFGAKQTDLITGNCTVGVNKESSKYFQTLFSLHNVKILLDTYTHTITFSDLPNAQVIPEYDPNVETYGCNILNQYIDRQNSANYIVDSDKNIQVEWNLRNVRLEEGYYLASANLVSDLPLVYKRNAILKYLYFEPTGNQILADGKEFTLSSPAESLNSSRFTFDGVKDYNLNFDPNTNKLRVSASDPSIYIIGDVWSENDVYCGWRSPIISNKPFYDNNFALSKEGDVYKGRFKLGSYLENDSYPDYLPQFHFFTDFAGWSDEYLLGSALEDFFCYPVDLVNHPTLPIIKNGRGRWGIDAPEKWFNVCVDLKNMMVTFSLEDNESQIEEISKETSESQTRWYTIQGLRVDHPTKGIYIKVKGNKREKVIF